MNSRFSDRIVALLFFRNNLPAAFFLVLLILQSRLMDAQDYKLIDSLRKQLKTAPADTNRVLILNQLAKTISFTGKTDTAFLLTDEAKALAEKLGFRRGLAGAYVSAGTTWYNKNEFIKASESYLKARSISTEINDKVGIGVAANNLGTVNSTMGNLTRALEYYLQALRMREDIKDSSGMATSEGNLGSIFFNLNEYDKSLGHFNRSLQIREKMLDKKGMAYALNGIGLIYYKRKQIKEALEYLNRTLKLREEMQEIRGRASTLNSIGKVYEDNKQTGEALNYYFRALELMEKSRDGLGKTGTLAHIAGVYEKEKKFRLCAEYAGKSLEMAQQSGSLEWIDQSARILSHALTGLGRHEEALRYYKIYTNAKDSLFNEGQTRQFMRKELDFEFERKQSQEKATQDKLNALHEERSKRQEFIIYIIAVAALIAALVAIVVVRSLRLVKKQKKIIEAQKKNVDAAYEKLHEKNKEVLDSITYARRIQRALITNEKYIRKELSKLNKKTG
jgi:tetratricopeptide (TPR) repeat protein